MIFIDGKMTNTKITLAHPKIKKTKRKQRHLPLVNYKLDNNSKSLYIQLDRTRSILIANYDGNHRIN